MHNINNRAYYGYQPDEPAQKKLNVFMIGFYEHGLSNIAVRYTKNYGTVRPGFRR